MLESYRILPEDHGRAAHQDLIDRLNKLFISVKAHHFADNDDLKQAYPIPSINELDNLLGEVVSIIGQDRIKRKY